MRKFHTLLKAYLRPILNAYRQKAGITQEAMAERLYMSTRSYCDLEGGKSGFSAATLILFLALQPDDELIKIIREFYKLVMEVWEGEE